MLTDEQRATVAMLDRPVVVLASAGSGKTTIMVHRYLTLLEHGIRPAEILTLSFTNEAADQLKARICRALENIASFDPQMEAKVALTPNIGTIHSFCYRTLEEFGTTIGLPSLKGILTSFEFATQFDEHYASWWDKLPQANACQLLSYVSHSELYNLAKEFYSKRFMMEHSGRTYAPTEDLKVLQLFLVTLAPLFSALSENLTKSGYLSFDELEAYTLQIFSEVPSVISTLGKRIRHILIDEFQDSSPSQYRIIEHFVGAGARLFAVGDPKQSIYRFRHADPGLFQRAIQAARKKGGSIVELSSNFRSHPNLLSEINTIALRLFEGESVPFLAMRPANGDLPHPLGGQLRFRWYNAHAATRETLESEQEAVGKALEENIQRGASNIVLLFRASERIPHYADALMARGISVACSRSTPLFRVYDVLDIVNYLKIVRNPLDDLSLASFLRSPHIGLSYQELWEIHQAPGASLFEKLMGWPKNPARWLVALIEKAELRTGEVLRTLFQSSPYWPKCGESLLEFLSPLLAETTYAHSIIERIESWSREEVFIQIEQRYPSMNIPVKLMTVHAAKGLEFDHVYIVDTMRQPPRKRPSILLRPNDRPAFRYGRGDEKVESDHYAKMWELNSVEEIAESKRILYVAMTRAKHSVTMFLPIGRKTLPKGSWAALLEEAVGS